MRRFEYTQREYDGEMGINRITCDANKLGEEGWELIQIIETKFDADKFSYTGIFKRENP